MKLNIITTISLMSLPFLLNAQDKYVWEPIPTAGILMKDYPADTSASAVVLADLGRISVILRSSQIECLFERKKRVKILKQAGYQYADVSIPLLTKDDEEALIEFEAKIYNTKGLVRTITKKDVFWEKTSDRITQVKFAFPEVQVGSVIEYTYMIRQKSLFILPDWYFQHEIPVLWSEVKVSIPNLLEYISLIHGTPPRETEPITDTEQVLTLSNGTVTSVTYYQKDMPALRPEAFITTMDDYYSRIRFQLKASGIRGYREEIFSSWEKSARELISHEFFGKKYLRKQSFDGVMEELAPQLQGITNQEEILQKIHQFVTRKLTWNGRHWFLSEEALDKMFARKQGSSADLNLLLCGLLNSYNIVANPMLISTREHGQVFKDYPIIDQFNYVVVAAQIGEKQIILDATQPYLAPGWVNEEALNGYGWIVDAKNPRWSSIVPGKSSSTHSFYFHLNETGLLEGKMSRSQEGYEAADSRAKIAQEQQKDPKNLKATLPLVDAAEYDSIQIKNLEEYPKALIHTAKFKLPEMLTTNGGLAYFNPVLLPFFAKNPFKTSTRDYPVDIPYPLSQRQVINFTIPAKFQVEDTPEAVNLTLPNNGGRFSYQVQLLNNRIILTTHLQINQLRYSAAEYFNLKRFFDLIIEKQQEQIVFKLKE